MLTIIANLTVDKEHLNETTKAILNMVKSTLEEEGCVRYELHQDLEDPTRFTILELWETRELWDAHMAGAAISEFKAATADTQIDAEIRQMTQIR